MTRVTWVAVALLAVSTVLGVALPSTAWGQLAIPIAGELPAPEVLLSEGGAILQRWELIEQPLWSSDTLPRAAGYVTYRSAVRDAGGDDPRPAVDVPAVQAEAEREVWRREQANVALMYAGGGEVRAVSCLEAALFALQDARFPQLTRPSEFIGHILRKDGRLKIYFHLLQRRAGTLTLGVPVPSTSDVDLLSELVARLGLREVWVTNGVYTGVVSAANLVRFTGRQ